MSVRSDSVTQEGIEQQQQQQEQQQQQQEQQQQEQHEQQEKVSESNHSSVSTKVEDENDGNVSSDYEMDDENQDLKLTWCQNDSNHIDFYDIEYCGVLGYGAFSSVKLVRVPYTQSQLVVPVQE